MEEAIHGHRLALLEQQRISCSRKVPFFSRRAAQEGLARLVSKPGCINPEGLVIYKCEACQRWHIGNRRKVGG